MENGHRKVLLVDDDRFLLDMYSLKLTKAGYDVKSADSPEGALKILAEGFEPNVMLIDVVMPAMSGLEFVAHIRKEDIAPKSAIIMLTNQSASEDIARSQKLKVDGYIVKATTIPSEVLAEMEKICSSKKA
ncbi:MAG: response regulator [Candidatus Paceibacterota bacterium]